MRNNLLEGLTDNIVVDKTKCVSCGICVETCILDNLRLKLAPCRQGCPLGINCQGYIQLIARGEEHRALELLRETLPFPGILGRICPAPCEDRCHRKKTDGEAVAIRALKRYLADLEESGTPTPLPTSQSGGGKSVAVVGSGPAGMMAAFDLAVRGHSVTIFEAQSAPGGMLRWAIPEFRLPEKVLEKEMALLGRLGVRVRCNVRIGQDKSLSELEAEFDAVILASGCPVHQQLGIEGEDRAGVYHGLPFLMAAKSGAPIPVGKKVLVIGGGNVAVDCGQTALRLGAESVTLVALESYDELPAFADALNSAQSEGVQIECSWGAPRLIFQGGRLSGSEFQKCVSVFDQGGSFAPRFDICQLKTLEADTLIIAIGQERDSELLGAAGLLDSGTLTADPLTLQTRKDRIFVAGDVAGGPSSVVGAMASGRQAAESVHRFLSGQDLRLGRSFQGPFETDFEIHSFSTSKDRRIRPGYRAVEGIGDFREIEQRVGSGAARLEAARCHSCGEPFGKYRTCWFCLPCEVECPQDAIHVEIPYLLR